MRHLRWKDFDFDFLTLEMMLNLSTQMNRILDAKTLKNFLKFQKSSTELS